MTSKRYISLFFGFVCFWVSAFAVLTLTVDPYGVSPLRTEISGINEIRPRRLDIDRTIKPYEVWRYQPDTVFLGTSRIHQSIDPSALEGTNLATAYNASIPASSLSMNISHLKQYLELNPNLKTVFVELFVYNFLGQGQDQADKNFWSFVSNSANLFVSSDTLWDSFVTLFYNLTDGAPTYEIKPGGHFYYPPGHDARGTFAGFPAGIWAMAPSGAESMVLHDPAIDTVRQLQALADEREIELIFVATPNHAYHDYFIEKVGGWSVVEEWLLQVTSLGMVMSFAQPNDLVYEDVSAEMKYWNDPFHFSLNMGEAMTRSLVGDKTGLPENFMVRLKPDMVPAHIAERRAAVRAWGEKNPDYLAALERERLKLPQ